MNLSRALKEKSRLASELERKKCILIRENSRRSDNESKINRGDLFDEILSLKKELVDVKSKIYKANSGISEALHRLQEEKSFLTFLKSISPKTGKEEVYNYGADKATVYKWEAYLDQEKLDNLIEDVQKDINSIQDHIDAYNATTEI